MGKYFYRVLLRVRPHPTLSLRTGGGDGGRRSFLCFARNGKAKPLPQFLLSSLASILACVWCVQGCVCLRAPALRAYVRVRACLRVRAYVVRDYTSRVYACVILFPHVCARDYLPRALVLACEHPQRLARLLRVSNNKVLRQIVRYFGVVSPVKSRLQSED